MPTVTSAAEGIPGDPPCTFAQWREVLAPEQQVSTELFVDLLRRGSVPAGTDAAVLELTKRYCERELNRQTRRLRFMLEQCSDGESVAVSCMRYSRACSRLLFFTGVEGMPRHPAERMAAEIREYVRRVLEAVAQDAVPSDDVAYCVRRLERRWVGDE